jgi:putative methyltransferase (TIGR04325 family)
VADDVGIIYGLGVCGRWAYCRKSTMASIVKIYPNYNGAMAECGDGYNDADLARVIAFRTGRWNGRFDEWRFWHDGITNAILAVGIARADLIEHPLRVLDFGGGCGVHYFSARSAFAVPLKWAIVETPTMACYAKTVSAGAFEAFDEIASAASFLGHVDLVIASSAIQYTPDPLASLDALIGLRAPYFMLARFPVWSGQTTVSIHASSLGANLNGFLLDNAMPPGITDRPARQPITFVNFQSVVAKLESTYRLVLSFSSPSGDYEVMGEKILGLTSILKHTG